MSRRTCVLGLTALLILGAAIACASPTVTPSPSAVPPTTPSPSAVPPQPTPVTPTVPEGFRITVISEQARIGTALTRDDKFLYVSELRTGNVLRLADTNGDGVFDASIVMAGGFNMPRALAFHPQTGELYVSSRGQVNALRDANGDGVAEENRIVVKGLYDLDYMHTNNGIVFGPDGKLYIADGAPRLKRLGKKGAAAMEPFAGTVLVANPDGSDLRVYAHGFRNPFGLAFAADGSLYATDNGEDSIPKPFQGDELNRVVENGDYGYPDVLGDPPPDSYSVAPLVNFPADSAPTAVVPYDAAQFPEKYRGNVFVALWFVGHKIVRTWSDDQGKWQSEDFITNLRAPVGMTLDADGSLYVLDMSDSLEGSPDRFSRIYRIEYKP